MSTPFFSVVIPTHNRAELLRQAVQSVLDQTYENFELLVIDDHSHDNTKEVISSFEDKRIRYYLNDRAGGGAGTRNAGIFRANGVWIAFLDDDDIWLPIKLDMTHKKIKALNGSIGLIYSGYTLYDFHMKQKVSVIIPDKEGWIQGSLLYTNCIGTFSAVAIRRNVLLKVGGLDVEFPAMQDWELYVRISGLTKVACIREDLTYVRFSHNNRISNDLQKKLVGSVLFQQKQAKLINKSPRLRHHTAARIFYFSFRVKEWTKMWNSVPWTLAGIVFDIHNFLRILWGVSLIFLRRDSGIKF